MVDPVRGQVILLLRRLKFNEVFEKEVEIKLQLVGEEQKVVSDLSDEEEFGGKISEIKFPEFAEDKVL